MNWSHLESNRQEDEITAILHNSGRGEAPVLTAVNARGRLRALLLEMTIEQHYRNDGSNNIETVYTFPLACDAVLLDLEVEIDGRTLKGVVTAKAQAESEYEEAVAAGNSAIMLEKSGAGLYTMNLGNLMAHETAVIRYRYAQPLNFAHGNLRVVLPTVIAPRYGDAVAQAGMRPAAIPGSDLLAAYPFSVRLEIEKPLAACRISSPSHAIVSHLVDDGALQVMLDRQGWLDRDFVVNIDGIAMGSTVVFGRDGDNTVAMASLCPPLPAAGTGQRNALALKVLVDCSGSMAGDSIAAAKRALHRILASLQTGDSVTYSRFGSHIANDTPAPVILDDNGNTLRRLSGYVAATDATLGGTEMHQALTEVFALGTQEAANVLLITDGETWDVDTIIQSAKSARQRVFVVGIGSAPAAGLLRKLAEATQGACEFVAPREDVAGCVLRMFGRMRAPRIRDVRVAWPAQPLVAGEVPRTLFENETLHLFAAFAAMPAGDIVLSWRADANENIQELRVPLTGTRHADDTLARLFAAQRMEAATAAGNEEEAAALALEYSLVSDYTHFLVVHERAEAEKAADLPTLRQVDQMMAAGWGGTGSVTSRCMESLECAIGCGFSFNGEVFSASSQIMLPAPRHRVESPAQLLDTLWAIITCNENLPATATEFAELLPESVADTLRALATRLGETRALAIFYAALLEYCRNSDAERQLLRFLVRMAKGSTPEDVSNAGLGELAAGRW